MAAQPHHSIGEVLSLLQAEYSDVTISKIRFLESQGLIAPERTPSGYRKFYAGDIARLRWILTQQRDNFLPLKVIKKRLEEPGLEDELEALKGDGAATAEPTLFANRDKPASKTEPKARATARKAATKPANRAAEVKPETRKRATKKQAAARKATTKAAKKIARKAEEPESPDEPDETVADFEEPVDSLSATDLAEAAGIEVGLVRELDRLGLIVSIGRPGSSVYGPEALEMANAAAVFGRSGLEPRHMRMYKVSAERQAGLLEQIFSPRLVRGGDSMQQARDELNELVRLGEVLQRSILRRSFGESLDGWQ